MFLLGVYKPLKMMKKTPKTNKLLMMIIKYVVVTVIHVKIRQLTGFQ